MTDGVQDREIELPGYGPITVPPYLDRAIDDRVLVLADGFARAEDGQPPVGVVTALDGQGDDESGSRDPSAGAAAGGAQGLECIVHVRIDRDVDEDGEPIDRPFVARELCLIGAAPRPGDDDRVPDRDDDLADLDEHAAYELYQARRQWVLSTYSADLLIDWEAYEVRTQTQRIRDDPDHPVRGGDTGQGDDEPEWIAHTLDVVPEVSALDALTANRKLVEWLTLRRWHVMRDAHEAGASWTQIGAALGMTKQGAHDWYRRTIATIDADVAAHNAANPAARDRLHHDTARAEQALEPDILEPDTDTTGM